MIILDYFVMENVDMTRDSLCDHTIDRVFC
jgi:hypothetical protein